jgi:hypothetical protein
MYTMSVHSNEGSLLVVVSADTDRRVTRCMFHESTRRAASESPGKCRAAKLDTVSPGSGNAETRRWVEVTLRAYRLGRFVALSVTSVHLTGLGECADVHCAMCGAERTTGDLVEGYCRS